MGAGVKGRILIPAVGAGIIALGACGEEGPTGVGADLVAPGIQTFEFELPGDRFLVGDTAVRGLFRPHHADEVVVALGFAGDYDSHTLIRFGPPPESVTWEDDEGETIVEADPEFVAGELRLFIRSARSDREEDVEVRVQPLAQDWHPASASWEFRVDTTGVREPWDEPGGTLAGPGGSAILDLESDTVVVALDSATIAHWLDEEGAARGARLSLGTQGVRLFIHGAEMVLRAPVEGDPERLGEGAVSITGRTFIADPPQPPPGPHELRVGGLPNWRAILHFRERVDTIRIPAGLLGGRSAQLGELQINKATLLLEPLPTPPGFLPEDTIFMEARAALLAAGVPVARAPLGERLNPVRPAVAPERFANLSSTPVEMVLTELLSALARPPTEEEPPRFTTLALLASPEVGTVGFASFRSLTAGEGAPRLRLVVTRGPEGGLR